jgi:hypothetical protein
MIEFSLGFLVGCWFMVGVAYLKVKQLERRNP